MVGINGGSIEAETEEHLQVINPGFIIIFARNISSITQVQDLIASLKKLFPIPPLIAVDQEGGRVIRFTKEITVFPGNMALGATRSSDLAYQQGLRSASQLKEVGIDVNLAPVVDVITSFHNPGITTRSFGDNPTKVAELAAAFIKGTQNAGVAAVVKHFPGKGAAEVDAHYDLPTIPISRKSFEEVHFLPFRHAIENGVQGIMSSHIHCPELENRRNYPVTFSSTIVKGFLRTTCNYRGVILSDDLEMGAIIKHHPIEDACVKAAAAGHDILLVCSNYQWQKKSFHALVDAYHTEKLPLEELEASNKRIQALRNFCSQKISFPHLRSEVTAETLAQEIAQKAITLLSNEQQLHPLNGKTIKHLHLLIPDLSVLPVLEEGYEPAETHLLVRECTRYFKGSLSFRFFSLNPDHEEIELLTQPLHALCVVFIADAQGNEGQRRLIKKMQNKADKCIFVLIDNPFDLEFLNENDTSLISYGYRRSQLQSLIKVMFGKARASGEVPFKKDR